MPFTEVMAILCIVSFFVLLALGIPVALTLAISGFVFGYIGFGSLLFSLLPARIFGVTANYTLIAIPLFVFMGVMLEKSKIATDLMDVIGPYRRRIARRHGDRHHSRRRADGRNDRHRRRDNRDTRSSDVARAPARGYDKSLACGTICASGTLGQLIPPSTILILLADIMGQSVGTLFAAAVFPGSCCLQYSVSISCAWHGEAEMAPPVPLEERQGQSGRETFIKFLRVGFHPSRLCLRCWAPSSEESRRRRKRPPWARLAAFLVTASLGRLTWRTLVDTVYATGRITAAMMFVLVCAQVFALAFRGLNGEKIVHDLFALVPGGTDGLVIFMLLLIFVLGFFIEWIEISYIVVPLFIPLLTAANVDPVWTATLIAVVLQTSFLTPPFGWALFYLRGVAPPEVTTVDIYKGVVPFIGLQVLAVALVFYFPKIATWLPDAIGW